jgi:hypothetical protein
MHLIVLFATASAWQISRGGPYISQATLAFACWPLGDHAPIIASRGVRLACSWVDSGCPLERENMLYARPIAPEMLRYDIAHVAYRHNTILHTSSPSHSPANDWPEPPAST